MTFCQKFVSKALRLHPVHCEQARETWYASIDAPNSQDNLLVKINGLEGLDGRMCRKRHMKPTRLHRCLRKEIKAKADLLLVAAPCQGVRLQCPIPKNEQSLICRLEH